MIDLIWFEVVFFLDRDVIILFLMWEKKKKKWRVVFIGRNIGFYL